MSLVSDVSFGPGNRGSQVGLNHGTINNTFLAPERSEPPEPIALIPFCRDPDFVDRGDLLDRLEQICSRPPHRAALVGLGGVGKSQLAIEFAHRFRDKHANAWVFWVHAGTRTRMEEGLRAIADTVKLTGRSDPKANVPQLVSQWLSNERNGRWMLVLDSADDKDVFFRTVENVEGVKEQPFATYLPQSADGHIVITTRDKGLADRLTGKHDRLIEVGPMTEVEALIFLKTKLGSSAHCEQKAAGQLIQALDFVPLAISQAAAYIQARTPRTSLVQYLAEFQASEQTRAKLLMHEVGDLRRDGGASNAILATWQISFDHIRSKRSSAADLLALMSFFDPQGIPESVLRDETLGLAKSERTTRPAPPATRLATRMTTRLTRLDRRPASQNELAVPREDVSNGGDTFEENMAMLRDYCLITVGEAGSEFEMHSLVQLSTRKWLAISGQQEKFQQQYIKRMVAAFPAGAYENWMVCGTLFAHVQAALQYRPQDNGLDQWATLIFNGAWYAWLQGRYEVAEHMASEARTARQQRLGKNAPATLASTSQFASIIKDRGRWDEAEKLDVEVMETYKTKLGVDHPNTLNSMHNLASTYWNQGRWDEAEKLQVEVIETRKTKLGPDHPDTLSSMANLGSTYSKQGRLDEAEKLEVKVIETRKTKLGPDHPNTLNSMANLASTYRSQGRWVEAEKLQVEVLETRRVKLGQDHPDTLTSMASLGSTYAKQGRLDEAEKLEVKVIETRKTKLGPDHPNTLNSMANLASTYRSQGRWVEAEKLEVEVLETRRVKLGQDHPYTLTSMYNLAYTWKRMDKATDAVALMESCIAARQRVLGQHHPSTLSSMATLERWKI